MLTIFLNFKNYDLQIESEERKRQTVGTFSATQSTVTGTGASSTVEVFTSLTVTVTAKDSSGNNIGTGGELIWIRLQKECTKVSNNFYWTTKSSTTFALSAEVWTKMTDNSDGTYTYTYTPSQKGTFTLSVYYFQSSGFYSEFFLTDAWTGAYTEGNISSTINYSWASSTAMTAGCNWFCCSSYYALVKAPVTDTYTLKVTESDNIYIFAEWSSILSQLGAASYTRSYAMTAGQYYLFYIRFEYISSSTPYLKLYWTYTGQAEQIIPSSNTYYPQYVGSTPISITASWATGYSDSVVGHAGTCYPVCGDGLRVGTEKCDNGSTTGTGGWSSDWTSITAGWVWSGGSSTSADTWTQWGAGYYQNDATTPTTWVTHWGDGLRVGSEKCDDSNTNSNDGWASDCTSIDSGWVCSGGSSLSADTCTKWAAGYHQNDSSNPTTCVTVWGDSQKAGTEKCDDGNSSNGDGCKSDCSGVESGWVCSGGTTSSKDTCTKCGAGYYQNDSTNPTVWVTKWGDGLRVGSEKCDDGNSASGDGWSSDWSTVEASYVCNGGSSTSKDVWYIYEVEYTNQTHHNPNE